MVEGRIGATAHQARIDTWKSIARYLARSSRTVQRWHREYGLPVHRLGIDSGSIFAYADELDSWLRNRDRAPKSALFEIPRTAPSSDLHFQSQLDQRRMTFDSPRIPNPGRQRSAALVAFACKLWASASSENLKMIARCSRDAIDLDPGNAEAFAVLADALIAEGLMGIVGIPAAYISAKAALERALEIDPELPETMCAAAWLRFVFKREWHRASREFDECRNQHLRLNRAPVGRALIHVAEGCPVEASALLRDFVRQNPLDAQAAALHCWCRYLAEDYCDALNLVEEARASGQSGPVLDAVEALICIHCQEPDAHISRIEALLADSPRHELLQAVLGYAFAANGQAQRATTILDALTHRASAEYDANPYAIALLLIGLGEKHDAVQWLEQSYFNGSLWSLGFPSDPILQSLLDEPGYRLFLGTAAYPGSRRHSPMSVGSSAVVAKVLRASRA
jgi:tetratricopeptide (TPR) repeat protein